MIEEKKMNKKIEYFELDIYLLYMRSYKLLKELIKNLIKINI
jgi:hypothetical protein